MVRRPAGGQGTQRPKGSASLWRRAREPRDPLQVTVKLRGGPEGWVEFKTRGREYRFPGHVTVLDVLLTINGHRPGAH